MNNPTKKTKLDDLAMMIEARLRFESLSHVDQVQEKLHQLKVFVQHLMNTQQGRADLEQRIKLLGSCETVPHETASEFYGRLRQWLDKDLTKHISQRRCRATTSQT